MGGTERGKLVVISGPSGAGKTSICRAVLDRITNARWSISVTTRAPRGSEIDGEEYNFVSRDQIQDMIANDELLEHAEYLGQTYGTPKVAVEQALLNGEVIILEIDVQGAAQVAQRMPESMRIFVLPPTQESLKARLEGRKTESEELREKRVREAEREIGFARDSGVYQHFVTNDDLEATITKVLDLISKEQAV